MILIFILKVNIFALSYRTLPLLMVCLPLIKFMAHITDPFCWLLWSQLCHDEREGDEGKLWGLDLQTLPLVGGLRGGVGRKGGGIWGWVARGKGQRHCVVL